VSDALVYAARAAFDAGRPAQAEELACEALTRAQQSSLPGTEAAAQLALARARCAQGHVAEAAQASTEALRILDRIGSVEGLEPEILLVHSDLCRRLGRSTEAESCLARARLEITRKAAFVTAPDRRARFVAELVRHAGMPQEVIDGA
jgi:tetratricopeptide (TPR) repeat protein